MSIIEISLIGLSLAADAFAVSVCKGLSLKQLSIKKIITISLYFGISQGLMPILGYTIGNTFENIITKIDHWIIFVLLVTIGTNMIRESFEKEEKHNDLVDFKTMLPLSIATSIDSLAIGITFSFLKVNILSSSLIITIITFITSIIGVKIGNIFGTKYKKGATILGGIILIIIGTKILLEHLNIMI